MSPFLELLHIMEFFFKKIIYDDVQLSMVNCQLWTPFGCRAMISNVQDFRLTLLGKEITPTAFA